MGLVTSTRPNMSLSARPPRRGVGLETDLWLNKSCWCNEVPVKTLDTLKLGWESFTLGALPDLTLYISLFGWFGFESFFYNKTVIVSIALFWVLQVIPVNYLSWGLASWIVASWSEVEMAWGTPDFKLVSEVRAVLWRTVPLTCEVWPNLGVGVRSHCNGPLKKPFEEKSGPS